MFRQKKSPKLELILAKILRGGDFGRIQMGVDDAVVTSIPMASTVSGRLGECKFHTVSSLPRFEVVH
jgi:hypothetical protein